MAEEGTPLNKMAQRILAHEVGDNRDTPNLTEATDRIFLRLRRHLTTYIGSKGHSAVLRHALGLVQTKLPLLAALELPSDEGDDLRVLAERLRGLNNAKAEEAVICLVTDFLGIMADLLGWDMTCRLVSIAWSELTFSEECSPSST